MLDPQEISQPKQLLVEGRDAYEFFRAFIKHLNLSELQIQNFGGVQQLRPFLGVLINAPNFDQVESIGIVRDAETSAESAFQSVCGSLKAYSLPIPNEPFSPLQAKPRLNVCILPGPGASSGMLENLCLQSVVDEPAIVCVEQYFHCLQQTLPNLPGNLEKAKLQAFLASRDRPGLLLGQAASRGYWNWEHPGLKPIQVFLRSL